MKLAIAAIVAISVLMMPTEGAAQSNPAELAAEQYLKDALERQRNNSPDTVQIDEAWSCDGEITLESACSPDGNACYGFVKIGNYPAKYTDFLLEGVHRRWNWCQRISDGAYECSFIIYPGGTGRYFNFRGVPLDGKAEAHGMRCTKTK